MFTGLCNVHNKSLCSISQGLHCSSLRFVFLGPAAKCLHHTFRHLQSSFSLCNRNPLPISGYRMSSFTQNRRMECCYPVPFPCGFLINSLESNFYLHYLEDFYRIYILFLLLVERTSPNIQSVQNVLTYTDRAPHWAPEMSRYSTSSSVSIFALGCKSLLCFMLWALPMLKEYSASSF